MIFSRNFLVTQGTVLAGLALGSRTAAAAETAADPARPVRFAILGSGSRGTGVMSMTLDIPGTTVTVINFDMQSPRPYDNRWEVQGTRGIYNEQRNAVYLTGVSPQYHQWEPFPPYQEKHQHPWSAAAVGAHGGADGIMLSQFVRAVRDQAPMPLSLYEGVLMAAVGPLSEMSIAQGSKVLAVPEFTSGKWQTAQPYFAVEA